MIKQIPPATPQKEKTRWTAGALSAIVLFCALSCIYISGVRSAEVVARKRELPVYCVARNDNVIAISFDAAWGGDQTQRILDILDEYGVKTTFFLVDIWTQRFPDLVREIADRGHEIGNHSTSHPQMSKLSREQILHELTVMSDEAEKITGVRPTLFRPPYGDYDNEVVLTAREAGYEVIQWSVDSLDWKNRGVKELIEKSTRNVKSGDIILFHNDSKYILDALPAILKSYQEQGFKIVPISQILLPGKTTIDAQGRQHPAATTVPEV
ncbi:MAG: polysaccharide deacetylase family protein [Clostridia bacterium]|nr:polysaccharide deacetylase family protein [Clostridia bacterium]